MAIDPDEPPASWDRRRLLLAFGAGAVNLAVLHRIDVSPATSAAAQGPPSIGEPVADGPAAPGPMGPVLSSDSARPFATVEPPAMSGAPEAPGPDHVFDLVIAGGRVMDPDSGFDGLADVGIDGDRITGLSGRALRGRRSIDATGRVVAPGFIDLLSYEPNSFGVWRKLADGVTTNLAMHGVNNYAAPFFGRYRGQTPIHYGGAFHHHFIRGFALGADIGDPLTAGQLKRLEALVEANLDGGFAGISFSPEYSPGTTTREMERLSGLAAARGHVCFFHVRYSDPEPPGTSLEAIDEVLTIAADTGVAVHIEHLTSTGATFVLDEAIDKIETAQASGIDVTACLYPYNFWGTFLASARFAEGWQERYGLTESDLQVAGTSTRLTPEGFAQMAASNKLVAALGSIPESEVQRALALPWTMVASDAIPTVDMNNHPRGAGTFARTIGRYVRELGVVDLMTGLAKLTVLPARRVESMIPAMTSKGRIQRGADADLVVFDPTTVEDRATIEFPATPSVGIDHVLVAGRLALRDGEVDRSVLAGRPLRSAAPIQGTAAAPRSGVVEQTAQ